MSDSPNSIDRATRITPATPLDQRRPERPPVEETGARAVEDAASFDGIPATIPDEVLAEIGGALDRLEELRADGTSVRFDAGSGSGAGIELHGADGTIREIGASELFDVVSGERAATTAPADVPPAVTPRVDREA
ncbi:hypothetical protein AB0L40_21360 [Patulibacter sp. NPDC049589]|uniref:hypothetical protein n=1 Tax=Patulibacter sp. NPDC049589 TaxID=3154731 RepID=UPI0034460883